MGILFIKGVDKMSKIIILGINENGDVSILNKNDVKLDKNILDEIADTYKRLNIVEKEKDTNSDEDYYYKEIFMYDYSKKSSLDVNS